MKACHLLIFFCFLLAACSSGEDAKLEKSAPTALRHLQQDQTSSSADQADGFTVSLIPAPLVAAQQAAAIISGCREETSYTWAVNGLPITEATAPQLSSNFFKRGDDVSLLVTCGTKQAEASERVQNSPPVILSVKFATPEIVSGRDLTVIPEAEDVDGDQLEFVYQWTVNGEYLHSVTGSVLPGEYVNRDNQIVLEVIPADQFDDGPVFEGLSFSIPNSPPKIISQPPLTFSSWTYEYQVVATDPDDDTLSFRLDQAPSGMSISAAGQITWPLENATADEYAVEVVVEDPEGLQSRQIYTLNLSPPE